jgi:hypothetical protein
MEKGEEEEEEGGRRRQNRRRFGISVLFNIAAASFNKWVDFG